MSYGIEGIELYVRDTPPGRVAFSLGRSIGSEAANRPITSPLAHVRLMLRDSEGRETFGCAADRLSVRWLDKRPDRDPDRKRRDLVALIHTARDVYLQTPEFDSPFAHWRRCHPEVMRAGRNQGQEDLTSSFASALMERALLDAVCRLGGRSIFEMVKQDRLGIRPAEIHPELGTLDVASVLPRRPSSHIFIRHTVGGSDPLTADELRDEDRLDDGLPETLAEYVQQDGLRYYKVKISGDVEHDLQRLARVWKVVLQSPDPVVTLDANEAFTDLQSFEEFVRRMEDELLGLFQHIPYIEQPLPRAMTLDPDTRRAVRQISQRKPLIIDEADGTLDAFKQAREIGYIGTSHKNCKGFLKSVLNYGLIKRWEEEGKAGVLSAEDLQNLPVVPLHQDFAAVSLLGLEHCERNGHHYNHGLSMLSEKDKTAVVRRHPDLYEQRGDEWFLKIRGGAVECGSLQCPGFGVHDEPDWASMTPMQQWVRKNHPE